MKTFSLKSQVVSISTTFSIALCAIFVPASMGFSSKSYAQSEASVAVSLLPGPMAKALLTLKSLASRPASSTLVLKMTAVNWSPV